MTASFLQRFNVVYMARFMADAVRRFPLPAVLSVALSVIVVAQMHNLKIMSDDTALRASLFCIMGFVAALATALYGEGHGTPRVRIFAVSVFVLSLLFAAVFVPQHLGAGQVFLAAAAGLFLLVSPFARRAASGDAVWGFVYNSALAVIFGGVSTLILAGGLSAILASIGYLFEIKISHKIYGDIWALGWCLFFPLYVLAGVPRQLEAEGGCDIPAPVSFIANYLLVPMMLAYTGILYAYGLKIALQWELPRGNLAYMVTGFGAVGVLTHLAIYPLRTRSTMLLRFFDRAFYALLPVPLLLLAVGIWTRINDYGLTEQRYAILLCLGWLAALAAFKITRTDKFHIKHVPLALAALCLAASFGPWSAADVSLKSQYVRLEQHLQSAGVLGADGKVQKARENVPFEERRAISSILEYLRGRSALARLEPWVTPVAETLTDAESGKYHDGMEIKGETKTVAAMLRCDTRGRCPNQYRLPQEIMTAWGMEYVSRWSTREDAVIYVNIARHNIGGQALRVAGYDYMMQGWVSESRDKGGTRPIGRALPKGHKAFIDGYRFYLTDENDAAIDIMSGDSVIDTATLPLNAAVEKMLALQTRNLPDDKADIAVVEGAGKLLRAEFRLSSFNYKTPEKAGDKGRLQSANGILLFSLKGE